MSSHLDKHISAQAFDLKWRFESKPEALEGIKVLASKTYDEIWDGLFKDQFETDYCLSNTKFQHIEELNFADDYAIVDSLLKELSNSEDQVVIAWANGQAIVANLKTFIDNWEDFYYPSSDDLIVINENRGWLIYISHFETIQIGKR